METGPVQKKADDQNKDLKKSEEEPAVLGNFASRDEQAWWEEHIIFG